MRQFTVVNARLFALGQPFRKIRLYRRLIERRLLIYSPVTYTASKRLVLRGVAATDEEGRFAKNLNQSFSLKLQSVEALSNGARTTNYLDQLIGSSFNGFGQRSEALT